MDTTPPGIHNPPVSYAHTEGRSYRRHALWYKPINQDRDPRLINYNYIFKMWLYLSLLRSIVCRKYRGGLCFLAAVLGLLHPAQLRAQEPLVKSGDSIAFMGDSITYYGAATPSGYVRLVMTGLEANGIKATVIPAGIGGQVSSQMLARVDHDIVSKKPAWMTLSCGVNDVWHGATGVPLDQYKVNMTAIVDKAQAAGIQVMILTATMIYEDPANAMNQQLIGYNDFLRSLAREKKCGLADLNADMQAALEAGKNTPHTGNLLTVDGVHMNLAGNQMMATGLLKAFGLSETQIQKARAYWQDVPGTIEVGCKAAVSMRQYQKLSELAAEQKCSVPDLISKSVSDSVQALLKTEPAKPSPAPATASPTP